MSPLTAEGCWAAAATQNRFDHAQQFGSPMAAAGRFCVFAPVEPARLPEPERDAVEPAPPVLPVMPLVLAVPPVVPPPMAEPVPPVVLAVPPVVLLPVVLPPVAEPVLPMVPLLLPSRVVVISRT